MENDKNTIMVAYRPGVGDPETMEAYGRRFKADEFVELPMEFAGRVRSNPSFKIQGEKSFGDEDDTLVIPDDPDYPKDAGTAADISFEEAVDLETAKEYGTTDQDLADRLRTARQHGRELGAVTRAEAEIAVAKKRGRPKKDTPPVDDEAKARAEQMEVDQAEIERRQEAEREAERQRVERVEAAKQAETAK